MDKIKAGLFADPTLYIFLSLLIYFSTAAHMQCRCNLRTPMLAPHTHKKFNPENTKAARRRLLYNTDVWILYLNEFVSTQPHQLPRALGLSG